MAQYSQILLFFFVAAILHVNIYFIRIFQEHTQNIAKLFSIKYAQEVTFEHAENARTSLSLFYKGLYRVQRIPKATISWFRL